jgi:hypothetical protein
MKKPILPALVGSLAAAASICRLVSWLDPFFF